MATTVDTLLVRIEADMSDLKRSLDKVQRDVDRSTNKMGSAFKTLGRGITALASGVVVAQLGRAGMAAINFASDVGEMQSKSKVVFGAFRDDVVSALDDFGQSVGRSVFELEGMASSIQDTFVPMGFARGEAAKLSVELTKLAVDVASFNNASDTETMEAFQSALVGNHETVRRFGIVITEATLKQELMRMGITKAAKDVSNAEKVQARLNLIMAGTSDAHGDAANTAASFANQMKAAQADAQLLAKEIGEELMPMALSLVGVFREVTQAILDAGIAMGIFTVEPAQKLRVVNKEISKLNEAFTVMEAMQGRLGSDGIQGQMANLLDSYGGVDEAREALNRLRGERDELRASIDELNAASEKAKKLSEGASSGPVTAPDLTPTPPKLRTDQEVLDAMVKQRGELKELRKEFNLNINMERDLARAIETKNEQREFDLRTERAHLELKKQFPDLDAAELDMMALTIAQRDLNVRKLEQQNKAEEEYAANKQARIDAGLAFVQQQVDADYNLTQSQEALNEARAAGAISADELAAANALLGLETLRLNPMFESFESGAIGLADGVSNAFADMAMGAKVSLQDFENMFKDFVKQMLAQAIKLLIVNAILRALGVPLRYDGSGFKAGAGDAFGGAVPQASAGGGAMSRGRPYLVGERGPELIIPASSGTIKNAHDTRNAMKGGATVDNQTINVETGVSQTVRAEMLSLLPVIKQDTLAAVADGKRRGGSFGQVLS
jgi:hypothetical protein